MKSLTSQGGRTEEFRKKNLVARPEGGERRETRGEEQSWKKRKSPYREFAQGKG